VETTPYGGISRGVSFAFDGSYFSDALGSTINVADLRGEIDGWISPPLSPRHTLQGTLVGRYFPGAPQRTLLTVGGASAALPLYLGRSARGEAGRVAANQGPDLAGQIAVPTPSFVEPLRGYEDVAFAASSAYIVSGTYNYPFIIDRGWASVLYLFPSLLVRQIDLEAFGDAALVEVPRAGGGLEGAWLRSAGAALHLRLGFGPGLPVTLSYQFAYRFDAGLRPLHFVGFTLL
jgi:hypothetical protein